VRLGQAFDTMRVIEDGLKGDERVVVNGLQRAIPRREVSPEVQEAEAPKPGAAAAAGG
jgi:hypothetical protein